jgi:hypothetical protein
MPWRECNVIDERVKFVARLLEGERWRRCAVSSMYRARLATRSLNGMRTPRAYLAEVSGRRILSPMRLTPPAEAKFTEDLRLIA